MKLYHGPDVRSYAGVGFTENPVATLYASVDGAPATNANAFSTTIKWGDGKSSTGDLVYRGINGSFATYIVKGSNVYDSPNGIGLDVTVTVSGLGVTTSALVGKAYVAPMPSGIPGKVPPKPAVLTEPQNVGLQLPQSGGTIVSYAGVGFERNMVTTLYASLNGQPDTQISNLQAQINWGDSSAWTKGELVYSGINGSFAVYHVKGSHVYSKANGNGNPVLVHVNGPDGTSITGQAGKAVVMPMPSGIPGTIPTTAPNTGAAQDVRLVLGSGGTITSFAGIGFEQATVAKLLVARNGKPVTSPSGIQVRVNWGDSSNWTPANLMFTGTNGSFGVFTVTADHTYASPNGQGLPIVVYAKGPDGTSTSAHVARALVSEPPKVSPIDAIKNAVIEAAKQFGEGFVDRVGGLWQFLTNDPVANQKAIAQGIIDYMIRPNSENHALWGDVLRQAMKYPARTLGGVAFDLILGKFVGLAKSGLSKAGVRVPGVSELPANATSGALDPSAKLIVDKAVINAQTALSMRIMTNFVRDLSAKLRPLINPGALTNPAILQENCVLVSEAVVRYLRTGQIHVAPNVTGGVPISYVEGAFGRKFSGATTLSTADVELALNTKNTSFGIIDFQPGGGLGHMINWFNCNGKILYLDIQAGELYTAETIAQQSWTKGVARYMDLTI